MIEINRLVRSKRKTLALIVDPDGSLTVRAPLKMKQSDILRFVDQKRDWILQKQAQAKRSFVPAHQYLEGERFLFLGVEYPLRIVPRNGPQRGNKEEALTLDGEFYLSGSEQHQAKSLFEAWYKKQARKVIGDRVRHFARLHNLKPAKIRISSARTRWGSCSAKGSLSFTWRLVMAPPEVIDYVVVHELCHLDALNHSNDFWNRVAAIIPEYKKHRRWLKDHGNSLTY